MNRVTPSSRFNFRIKIKSLNSELKLIQEQERSWLRKHKADVLKWQARKIATGELDEVEAEHLASYNYLSSDPYVFDPPKEHAKYLNNRRSTLKTLEQARVHARLIIRPELRHSYLALAYARGRPYLSVEKTCRTKPNPATIIRILGSIFRMGLFNDFEKAKLARNVTEWLSQTQVTT